ncbi:MAG: hypothetical protein V4510_03985 [bacterium]
MARDPQLLKRNLLVLPGGLLAFFATLGLVYFLAVRPRGGLPCAKYTQVLYHGSCYTTTGFLVGMLLVGLILVAVGLVVFRSKPKVLVDHLYHGTPSHFGLALLAAFAAIPFLAYVIVLYLERALETTYVMNVPGTSGDGAPTITLHVVLGCILLAALVALVPYCLLMVAQGQLRRRFLREAETYEEPEAAFPGEPAEAPADLGWQEQPPAAAPPPEEFVDEAMWPGSRDSPEVEAAPVEGMQTGETATTEDAAWTPPPVVPGPPPVVMPVAVRKPTGPTVRPAPIVPQAPGCRAMRANGMECGEPVGPGGRYCLRHACQGRTASGSPCRNPALEGGTRCRAHSSS